MRQQQRWGLFVRTRVGRQLAIALDVHIVEVLSGLQVKPFVLYLAPAYQGGLIIFYRHTE